MDNSSMKQLSLLKNQNKDELGVENTQCLCFDFSFIVYVCVCVWVIILFFTNTDSKLNEMNVSVAESEETLRPLLFKNSNRNSPE